MRFSIWQQKIPTILGLIAIVIGIFVTSYLSQNTTVFHGFASTSDEPKSVRITNITDSSFTVSYTTDDDVIGSLVYGPEKTTALDDRDNQNNVLTHNTHTITVRNLKPSVKYTFAILSGQTTYSQQNGNSDSPFEVTTAPALSSSPKEQKVTGILLLPDGSPAKEGIVYLKTDLSQLFSAGTSTDGSYSFQIGTIRTLDLSSFVDLQNSKILSIFATSGKYSSNITTLVGEKIPTVILSNDYDFTLNPSPIATFSAAFGFPSLVATPSATNPAIARPKEGEQFTDQRPQFKGTALPGATVDIIIHSDEQTTQIVADNKGNWIYRPSSELSPGQHSITIQTKDQFGVLRKITQSFTVFAQGSQVNQPATPSATITFSPTPVPTNVVLPTITATPTPFQIVPTKPQPPQSGDQSAVKGTVIGAAISLLGFLLVVFTRGRISL